MGKRKQYTPAEIIDKLRNIESLVADGKTQAEAARAQGVTEQTYYRWKRKYANMGKPEAKKLKDLERENARLKKLLANAALDIDILKEALKGNY